MTCKYADKTSPRMTTGSVVAGDAVDTFRVGEHKLDRAEPRLGEQSRKVF